MDHVRFFLPSRRWLAPFVAALLVFAQCAGGEELVSVAPAPALFQRIVLLGASVTAGFDSAQPLGPKTPQYRLAHYVEATLAGAHEPVTTHASLWFFQKAAETLERQVTAVIAGKPSLVVTLDGMFWFCYGAGVTDEQRLARFDTALQQLERIDAPLVVGDIPDATEAVGGVISKTETPDPATIVRCNERLKTWAASRPSVTVFSLSRFMAASEANDELTFGGITLEKGKSSILIQRDRLHPSRHGVAALAIGALDAAAASTTPPLPANTLCHDLNAVYEAGIARGEAEMAARAKK